jgi:hypothetical protein
MPTFLHQDVAFAPKYKKVRDIGFVTGNKFIGRLLEEAMKVDTIYDMSSRIMAFDQNRSGVLYSPSIILAMSMSILFLVSTTPFY